MNANLDEDLVFKNIRSCDYPVSKSLVDMFLFLKETCVTEWTFRTWNVYKSQYKNVMVNLGSGLVKDSAPTPPQWGTRSHPNSEVTYLCHCGQMAVHY